MASGMGVPGVCIDNPEDIAAAAAKAMETDGPYLLELVVEGLETR